MANKNINLVLNPVVASLVTKQDRIGGGNLAMPQMPPTTPSFPHAAEPWALPIDTECLARHSGGFGRIPPVGYRLAGSRAGRSAVAWSSLLVGNRARVARHRVARVGFIPRSWCPIGHGWSAARNASQASLPPVDSQRAQLQGDVAVQKSGHGLSGVQGVL